MLKKKKLFKTKTYVNKRYQKKEEKSLTKKEIKTLQKNSPLFVKKKKRLFFFNKVFF